MNALFVELPDFCRRRRDYLDDENYCVLQFTMAENPEAGDLIEGTEGLRKLCLENFPRGKGKRGSLRVIYHWREALSRFWLYTLYETDEPSR